MNIQVLRSFRLVCPERRIPLVEKLLLQQGFRFETEAFSPFVRRLVHEPFPLGSSLAARFGYLYIQDRSSMLPPLALNPKEGAAVLDMCASPGSKTGFLAQLVGSSGFVLGNEPSQNRLATLRHNLMDLNLLHTGTTSCTAESFPLLSSTAEQPATGWPFILLDPPCSGWGTVEKNPKVLSLWQGDKVKPLIALQRALLRRAFALLQPGGRVVYSTCTTNPEENQEQVRFACEELGFSLISLSMPQGFMMEQQDGMPGVLSIATSDAHQGFFVALLQKEGATLSDTLSPARSLKDTIPEKSYVAPLENTIHTRHSSKVKKIFSRQTSATALQQAVRLSRAILADDGYDETRLPAGEIAVFNQIAHFLPQPALDLLPPGLNWKGFPLGKEHNGRVRLAPTLRALMPEAEEAARRNMPILNLDEITSLEALLTGQSMQVETSEKSVGLYIQGLPLCRLPVKNKRAVLPAL